jgi:hypothetical protein
LAAADSASSAWAMPVNNTSAHADIAKNFMTRVPA